MRATGTEVGWRVALFDLSLTLADRGGEGLLGGIEYSTELFDAVTVGRIAGHLGVLLAAVAADPARRLSRLAVLTGGERDQLVRQGTGAVAAIPAGGVPGLIAARAAARPDEVAVACGAARLTYRELADRAARLAGYLRGAGVGAESVVGLCLDRGVELVTAIVAVWQAGGAYLPLDPQYPPGRLGFMVADSRTMLVLAGQAVGELAGEGAGGAPWDVDVVRLDDPVTAAVIAACPPSPAAAVAPAGLASVIYTSGSTGQPKGTLVTHGSLAAVYAGWASAHFGPGDAYRWLSLASASFDVFTGDLVRALCSGGTLVLGPVGLQLSAGPWAALLARERISALECAPRYADELAAHLDRAGQQLVDLRLLVVTTDVWRAAAAARARAVLGPATRILTAYGTTETTIDSTCCDLTAWRGSAGLDGSASLHGPDGVGGPGRAGVDGAVPIGGPLPGTRVLVLDRYLGPVPAGVPGDLWIGGAGVARGYTARPALTAGRFVADWLAGDGSRLYRTGDRARWRADGQLEFLGRADDQVKIRGFRIEPGEIEATLTAHPGVTAAVVTADGDGDARRLAAWLVPDPPGGIPPVSDLRAFLAQRLPEFMVPAVFTELAALPLTVNGKLDRAALPAPDAGRPDLADRYVAPATPTEELLAGIWAQVLRIDQAGTQDSFFDLGGHSLLAIQVISRSRVVFGVEVPLAALFDQPTITGLAAVVEGQISEEIEQMSEDEVLQNLDMYSSDAGSAEDGAS